MTRYVLRSRMEGSPMSVTDGTRRPMDWMARWIDALLKAGRAINAVTATLCILLIAIGLVIALYFQSVIWKGPDHLAVPPEAQAAPLKLELAAVDARLKPPANVRVTITHPIVDENLKP